MTWVSDARDALQLGKTVSVRPTGGSMRGRIESGDLVTLAPVPPATVSAGDVVFVRWKGSFLLHLVVALNDDRAMIGNALGKINGWVSRSDILGVVVTPAPDQPEMPKPSTPPSWRSPYPTSVREVHLMAQPRSATIVGEGFTLRLVAPNPIDRVACLLEAWEILVFDTNREASRHVEFGRFRVEGWDEAILLTEVHCDAFESLELSPEAVASHPR